jgi:hypothetical protein
VEARIRSNFTGTETDFSAGFSEFAPYVQQAGLDPKTVAQTYPEDMARMVGAYLESPQGVAGADDPLWEAARRGNAETFLADVYGMEAGISSSLPLSDTSTVETPAERPDTDQWESA